MNPDDITLPETTSDGPMEELRPKCWKCRQEPWPGARWDRIEKAARAPLEARLADLDAELARVGLEGASVAGLLRHHRNNEAAANGGWKLVADALETTVATLREALRRGHYKAGDQCQGCRHNWPCADYLLLATPSTDILVRIKAEAVAEVLTVERITKALKVADPKTEGNYSLVTPVRLRAALLTENQP